MRTGGWRWCSTRQDRGRSPCGPSSGWSRWRLPLPAGGWNWAACTCGLIAPRTLSRRSGTPWPTRETPRYGRRPHGTSASSSRGRGKVAGMGAGAAWKIRREEMGKTLGEASSELRISQKYLRDIEEGNYSRWPAKVFSTGFIRAYASFLSVDPEPVLSEYQDLLERQSVQEPPFHASPEWLGGGRRPGGRRGGDAGRTGGAP